MLVTWYPVLFSIGFAIISMGLKIASRRNSDASPLRNDCYCAQSLVLGSLSASLVYLIRAILTKNDAVALDCAFLMFSLLLPTVGLVVLDRFFAWETSAKGDRREKWYGIVLPNVTGAIVMCTVFIFARVHGL